MRHMARLRLHSRSLSSNVILPALASLTLVCFIPDSTAAQSVECSIDKDQVTVSLEANPFEWIDSPDGQRLDMEGFRPRHRRRRADSWGPFPDTA